MTPEAVAAIKDVLRLNPVILEIGAADGTDTADLFTLARAYGKPNFHAFEPDPRNTAEFRKKWFLKDVVLNECAVSDHDGTRPMYFSDGKHPGAGPDGWSFSNTLKQPTGHYQRYQWVTFKEPVQVATVRLDTYYRAHLDGKIIDFIWADVNGAERELILGGPLTLGKTRYFLTEFARGPELFVGQPNLWDLARLLPYYWQPVVIFESDILLKNMLV